MQQQDKLKQQADAVQKFLSKEGVTLPRGKALDLVARLCGDKEWNSLNARLKATAPGAVIPRCADVLRDILTMMEMAKEGLDEASDVHKDFVDAGDDPDFAYQRHSRELASAIEQVKAIISGDHPVKEEKRPVNPRVADILKDLNGVLGMAKAGLDDASPYVDRGDDEEYTYQHEIEAVEQAQKRIEALLSGKLQVQAEDFTLFVFTSIELEYNVHLLVPSSVNIVKLEAQLHAWVDKQRAAEDKANDEDDDAAIDEVNKAWTEEGVIAEAVRLGAIAPKKVTSSRQWDFGQFQSF
jgi:hypothetical protein